MKYIATRMRNMLCVIFILLMSFNTSLTCLSESDYKPSILGKWSLDTESFISSATNGRYSKDSVLFENLTVYYEFFEDGIVNITYAGRLLIEDLFPVEIVTGIATWTIDEQCLYISNTRYEWIQNSNGQILLISDKFPTMKLNRMKTFSKVIQLGCYEQDGNEQNGKEGIEWFVVEDTNEYMLLLSKYALKAMPFSDDEYHIVWSNSLIYDWLNTDFLNSFDKDTQSKMQRIAIDKDGFSIASESNPHEGTLVSLLSLKDIEKYINAGIDMSVIPSIEANDDQITVICWWLRDISPIVGVYCIDQFNRVLSDFPESTNYVRPVICLKK